MTTTRYTDPTVSTTSTMAALPGTMASPEAALPGTMASTELTTPFAWASSPLGTPEAEPSESGDGPDLATRRISDDKPTSTRNAGARIGVIAGALGVAAAVGLLIFLYSGSAQAPSEAVAPGVVAHDSGRVPVSAPVASGPPAASTTPMPVVTNTPAGPTSGGAGSGKGGGTGLPADSAPAGRVVVTNSPPPKWTPPPKGTPPPEPCKKRCQEPATGYDGK